MAKQLLGKEVTAALNAKLQVRRTALAAKGIVPKLGIVRCGENPSDISYEKGAMKRAETIGVETERFLLPEDISKEDLIAKIKEHEPFWIYLALFSLIAVKEVLMVIGGLIMLKQRKVAHADWYGKTATGLFALGIVLTLLSFAAPRVEPWNIAVLSAAVGLSYVAMAHYARTQMFKPREDEPDQAEERLFEKFDRLAK
jgi:hypothetical protein